jgi:hypothetical protein
MSAGEVSGRSRPEWISEFVWIEYLVIRENGEFSGRKAKALEILFTDESLAGVWQSLNRVAHASGGWNELIRVIINNLDCAPPGQRATRDAPDEKIEVLERQKRVDVLLAKALKAADTLVEILWELEENGGEQPAEVYSGLALIRESIAYSNMARACCARPFEKFERGLSSYEKSYFPSTGAMIETLANAMKAYPKSAEHFKDDPWLSSRQSSWKDYVRALKNEFQVCRECHGDAPRFTDAEWTSLLKALISDSLEPKTVAKGLREL